MTSASGVPAGGPQGGAVGGRGSDPAGGNPSTVLARALLGELVHQGVREVVLSPGSRSAPLAFAALRLSQAGRIRLHVRVDERSAGFLALGLAKVSGDPVAVVCTSGTAVANLAPAVVEASYAAIPLVVVTADRPVEARGVGSPQTIDQVQFFGSTVRFFADLGAPRRVEPQDPDGPQRAARASVGMAIAAALGVGPGASVPGWGGRATVGQPVAHLGPVHLNVGFRLPLVPDSGESLTAVGGTGRPAATAPGVPATAPRHADHDSEAPGHVAVVADSPPRLRRPPLAGCVARELGDVIGEVPARGVVVVGDLPCDGMRGPHQWLSELAGACGWPIIAEPSANLHYAATALGHGVLVLADDAFLTNHVPDLVVTAGVFGLSRPTMELVRRARRHVAIELPSSGREVCDPLRTADQVIAGVPLPPSDQATDPNWLAEWLAADAVAAQVVHELVTVGPVEAGPGVRELGTAGPGVIAAGRLGRGATTRWGSRATLTGAAAAARVWSRAPADALLLVAASWPVRQVEAFAGHRYGLRVIGNRGANGIDGLISTAWGAALAHQSLGAGPALALMGDLAFLHDHNGLLAGADEPRPDLVVVVIDNDGGGIFHQLEQGRDEFSASFERLFGTPLGLDLAAIATAAGVPARRVADAADLDEALDQALAAGGVRLVVVDAPDRAGEAALLKAVHAEFRARLAASLGGPGSQPPGCP